MKTTITCLVVVEKMSCVAGVFTAEANSVEEDAAPLDTFVQLPGAHHWIGSHLYENI